MRQAYIAGNWKMNKTIGESLATLAKYIEALRDSPHKLMIAPPFTALSPVSMVLEGSNILLGAQNMAAAESGAHTGEISPDMLRDAGVRVVILGHSERRHLYGESDDLINRKIGLALKHGLETIFCVGETIEERESGRAEEVVRRQLGAGLQGIDQPRLGRITVAYEPVWAIGTGKTATPEDADAMHRAIRDWISGSYGDSVARGLTIQYGGSVKSDTMVDLMQRENIDGVLVGGASLTADAFLPIARYEEVL